MFKYTPDGTSTHRPNGNYMEWRVLNEDGELVCAFYGGAGLMAASLLCDHLNKDDYINPNTDGWIERSQKPNVKDKFFLDNFGKSNRLSFRKDKTNADDVYSR